MSSQAAAGAKRGRQARLLWLSLLPAVVILVGFLGLFLYGVYQSFTDFRFGRARVDFEGFANYAYLFDRSSFINSIRVTLVYAFSAVALEAVIGLALAKLFNSGVLLAKLFRPVILLPLVLPPMSVALMWTTMMDPETGVLNYFLSLVGLPPYGWISQAGSALPAIIFVDVWTFTPFFTLIIFAGLRGITPDIIEAARINGAKAWSIFLRIELPLVLPYILIAAVFRLIDSLNQFDIIFGTTQGGPGNATEVLSVAAYITAFQNLYFGRGSAMMVVNWLLVLVAAFLTVKAWQWARRRIE